MRAAAAPPWTFLSTAYCRYRRLLVLPFEDSVGLVTGRGRSRRDVADGTAPGGAAPSKALAPRHDAPPLRACSRSRWDRSGRRTAAEGTHTICIREATGL